MRVAIVDLPAYTPPYDRSLCAALARAGVEATLLTSRFTHGEVPPPAGYEVREAFYRRSATATGRARRGLRAAEHLKSLVALRREVASFDVVHYQWLTFPALDSALLPPARPRVLTPHGWLRAEGRTARGAGGFRRLARKMDAVVALTERGAARLREDVGVDAGRVKVVPHGAFDYLTRLPDEAPLPPALADVERPVVLCFGLIRPYKGVELLIEAFRDVPDAELWVVGRPLGMSIEPLRRLAKPIADRVRIEPRFVAEREVPSFFRRADLVVLPYRDAEQSGVLFAALAFGKAIVVTDVGGFAEVAATGAARSVPPADVAALAAAIDDLIGDPPARRKLEEGARAAAAGPYSWDTVAERTISLYRSLLDGSDR
jgi:glycosyltransferase involved in cell wall biosynthesis